MFFSVIFFIHQLFHLLFSPSLLILSTNQRSVLLCVNQSEESIYLSHSQSDSLNSLSFVSALAAPHRLHKLLEDEVEDEDTHTAEHCPQQNLNPSLHVSVLSASVVFLH